MTEWYITHFSRVLKDWLHGLKDVWLDKQDLGTYIHSDVQGQVSV